MQAGLLSELEGLQRLLAGDGPAPPGRHVPSLPPALSDSSDDEEAGGRALAAARGAAREQQQRLQREAAKLQQQLHAREEECERLRTAAARERDESAAAIGRLQAQLLQQRAEVGGRGQGVCWLAAAVLGPA